MKVRLTRRGWATAWGGIGTIVAGRLVGLDELFVVGAAALGVVLVAFVSVRRVRLRLDVFRDVRPSRVPVGATCRVELRIVNRGRVRTPVVVVTDPVGDGQRARLRLAPLAGGDTRIMRYRLPVHRRGIISVGPLSVEHADPFGLVQHRITNSSALDVIVLPRVHPLDPVPPAPGDEPDTGSHQYRTLATANEEFASLREYLPGDDVRKVHWPSTARMGHPIVRHFDEPWQRRSTIVLDVRRGGHDEGSFERAVSAAASVLMLCVTRGELVRLVTTGGQDTGFINSEQEVDAAMDLLAGVKVVGSGSLTGTLRTLIIRRLGGTLVTCTGTLPDSERSLLTSTGGRFGTHLAVVCGAGGSLVARPGTEVVLFTSDDRLNAPWADAVARFGSAPRDRRPA